MYTLMFCAAIVADFMVAEAAPVQGLRRIAVMSDDSSLWKDGVVPYYFDGTFPSETKELVHEVVKYFEAHTCVKFKEVDSNASGDKVKFFKGTGCNSSVGDAHNSQLEISLGENCDRKGIIMHEMMHTLGFYHEQSRPDRDQYVTIKEDLIKPMYMRSFNINKDAESYGTPYDYKSIMHLHSRAFTKEKGVITIETKDKSKQSMLGQRDGPSDLDLYGINRRYSCAAQSAALAKKLGLKGAEQGQGGQTSSKSTTGQSMTDDIVAKENIDTSLTDDSHASQNDMAMPKMNAAMPKMNEVMSGTGGMTADITQGRRKLQGGQSTRMKLLRRLAAASYKPQH